jgi:hypothetical protein
VHALVLDTWLNAATGQVAGTLEGARCTVRYLFGGRETEVDLGLVEAVGQIVDGRLELEARCAKRFEKTTSGAPHAPGLPAELHFSLAAPLPAQ